MLFLLLNVFIIVVGIMVINLCLNAIVLAIVNVFDILGIFNR